MVGVPHHWHSIDTGFAERRVPDGQHRVPQAKDIANDTLVWLVEQERLTTLSIDMRVRTEEGREGTDVVPPHKHLCIGVAEETSDVSWKPC